MGRFKVIYCIIFSVENCTVEKQQKACCKMWKCSVNSFSLVDLSISPESKLMDMTYANPFRLLANLCSFS